MRTKFILTFSIIIILLTACSFASAAAPLSTATLAPLDTPTPTADLQATVEAGIEATMQAESSLQATVDAAVAATVTAEQAAAEVPSEEEMAAEIDTAVEEVAVAAEEVVTTTSAAAADGTITTEEYDELAALLVDAAILLDYADYWVETYYWYYGDLAEETLVLLEELETLLTYTEDNMDEIIALLEAGTELAGTALDSLETFAQNAEVAAAQLDGKSEEWQAQLVNWQQTRAGLALDTLPSQIPADRAAAIQEVRNYAAAVRSALEDQLVSASELQNIAQLGANAVAGLESQGGLALQSLAGNIDQLTQMAALGQFSQLAGGLGNLEARIP